MKVTSALLFALEFSERNSTKPGCGPQDREIVMVGSRGSEIIIDGTIDEAVAGLARDGVDLPEFIGFLMNKAADIAAAQTKEMMTARFASAILLATLAAGVGPETPKV